MKKKMTEKFENFDNDFEEWAKIDKNGNKIKGPPNLRTQKDLSYNNPDVTIKPPEKECVNCKYYENHNITYSDKNYHDELKEYDNAADILKEVYRMKDVVRSYTVEIHGICLKYQWDIYKDKRVKDDYYNICDSYEPNDELNDELNDETNDETNDDQINFILYIIFLLFVIFVIILFRS